MYIKLSKKMTKQYFREILFSALEKAKNDYLLSPDIPLNISIYNQLLDIKKTVIDENKIYTEKESREKYPLGVMVVRNFDGYLEQDWDYPKKLIGIAGGVSRYPTMPEK